MYPWCYWKNLLFILMQEQWIYSRKLQWERIWVNIICIVLANNVTTVILFCGNQERSADIKRAWSEIGRKINSQGCKFTQKKCGQMWSKQNRQTDTGCVTARLHVNGRIPALNVKWCISPAQARTRKLELSIDYSILLHFHYLNFSC